MASTVTGTSSWAHRAIRPPQPRVSSSGCGEATRMGANAGIEVSPWPPVELIGLSTAGWWEFFWANAVIAVATSLSDKTYSHMQAGDITWVNYSCGAEREAVVIHNFRKASIAP